MLSDFALIIQVVATVFWYIALYGALLTIFLSIVLYLIGWLVYAYLGWRSVK
jgi:hypothetical protein